MNNHEGTIVLKDQMRLILPTVVERKAQISGQAYRLPVEIPLLYQSLATAITITILAVFVEGLATQ